MVTVFGESVYAPRNGQLLLYLSYMHNPLPSGITMPQLGFGTWHLGEQTYGAVATALEVGYRHIDTADRYDNHEQIARAIADGPCAREDIFLTTKLWRDDLHAEDVRQAAQRFLRELDTDYLDMLMIHWPNRSIPISETLDAMQQLKESGTIRSIGVSNFTENHLRDALETGVTVDTNQVECHPTFNQRDLKQFCDKHGIVLTAYSPNGQGEDLKLPTIRELADQYTCSPSQVIISWLMQRGIAAIPRSATPAHIRENFDALLVTLSPDDVTRIDTGVPQGERMLVREFSDFDY